MSMAALANTPPVSRRLFLASGSSSAVFVALGRAVAQAAPAVDLERYIAWLAREHRAALAEHLYPGDWAAYDPAAVLTRLPICWLPDSPAAARLIAAAPPSARAAAVLRLIGLET